MRWNSYLNSHFSTCQVVQKGADPHRGRLVTVYALPGEFELVGISDGCESWIAPVNVGFLQEARRNLDRIRSGKLVELEQPKVTTSRTRVRVAAIPQPTAEGAPRARVRVAV